MIKRVVQAGVGANVLAHAGPYLLTLGAYEAGPMRMLRNLTPHLYGVGRPGHLALTFDDGPDNHGTPQILDTLDRYNWKATFFMLGEMVRRHPKVAKDVVARGHEVGVHGYAHGSFMRMHAGAAISDIRRACEAIEDITAVSPKYFRPPYGTLSGPSLVAARVLKLPTILWSAWGQDWRADATPVRIVANATEGLLDGGTLLLHDSDCTSATGSWRNTVGSLELLHELTLHDGLSVGTLGEHF